MRRPYLIIILFVVALLSFFSVYKSGGPPNNTSLKVETAPSGVSIKLDNKSIKDGVIKVPSGNHDVKVTKNGFSSKSETFTTTTSVQTYVGIALNPDSSKTSNWYAAHPSDQLVAQSMGSHEADYINALAVAANPLIKDMPILYGDGQGGLVNISTGVSLFKGGPPAVYISGSTPLIRHQALLYLQNRGFNFTKTDVVFTAVSNPLVNSGGD